MSKMLGPLEVCCDAPEYVVVQACGRLGIISPEDVPWRRIRTMLAQKGRGRTVLFEVWRRLCGWGIPVQERCACGAVFPGLQKVRMTFNTGEVENFVLGQCKRCRAVFWEQDEEKTGRVEP